MAPILLESDSNSASFVFDCVEWSEGPAYRCHICLIPEDDGAWSAIVLNLPGAASEGTTEEEAVANVTESIRGLIASYNATNDEIPWKDSIAGDIPTGAKTKWILVNV